MKLYFVNHCYSGPDWNDEASWISEYSDLVAVFVTREEAQEFISKQRKPEYYSHGPSGKWQKGGPRSNWGFAKCYRYVFTIEEHDTGAIISNSHNAFQDGGEIEYSGLNPEEHDKIVTALSEGKSVYDLDAWDVEE